MAKLIPGATTFLQPATEDELTEQLTAVSAGGGEDEPGVLILAGGTSLAFSRPDTRTILDLNGLPFRGCRTESGSELSIGAVTTVTELENDPETAGFCGGILRQATDMLASTPLRNLITAGGNLAAGYAWCDLPVAFLALDGRYELFPGGEIMEIPAGGDRS
ncbi:MAG TPA: FAD binding domain-containing protein, partial [bacterium]|nr:FAD binding domain-containing protein [bacterium]